MVLISLTIFILYWCVYLYCTDVSAEARDVQSRYIGCYKDEADPRTLPSTMMFSLQMTFPMCLCYCFSNGKCRKFCMQKLLCTPHKQYDFVYWGVFDWLSDSRVSKSLLKGDRIGLTVKGGNLWWSNDPDLQAVHPSQFCSDQDHKYSRSHMCSHAVIDTSAFSKREAGNCGQWYKVSIPHKPPLRGPV